MVQRNSPSDSGLLTVDMLRQIRAAVLRWVRDNPSNIRAIWEQQREMIESIIRYRLKEKLGPALPKSPVLGGVGVAYAPDDYTDDDRTLYMDTGMSIYDIDIAGAPLNLVEPITIYGGEDLRDNYSGTVMPDTTTDYLIGRGDGDTCPVFPDSHAWGSQGEYTSDPNIGTDMEALFLSDCAAPAKYTGMLRLAAQAKLGAGRSPATLSAWTVVDGCGLDPKSDGIFKDSSGVYWVFRTDSTGCKCARLTTNNVLAQCLQDWVEAGYFTDLEEKARVEAYVMSTLVIALVDNSPEEYQLLSDTDISAVYTSGASPLGNVTGWHYSRGHHGTGDGEVYESVIVTHRIYNDLVSVKYHEATLARIEFDLTGPVPSAQLVVDELNTQWEPSDGDLIFYPMETVDGLVLCYVQRGLFSSPRGVGAPVYAYYREDGLEVIRYSWRAPTTFPSEAWPTPVVCGCGGSLDQSALSFSGGAKSGVEGEIYAERANVHLDLEQLTDSNAVVDYKHIVYSLGSIGENTCTSSYANITTQVRIQADITACSGTSSAGWPGQDVYTYNIQTASATGFYREWRARAPAVRRHLIIPHGDNESVYLFETTTSDFMISNKIRGIKTPSNPIGCNIKITASDQTVIDDFPSQVGVSGGLGIGTLPCNTSVNAEYEAEVNLGTGEDYTDVNKVYLLTSKKVFTQDDGLSTDYDDWDEWYTVYLDVTTHCHDREQWTQGSYYYGDCWFSIGPSTSKKLSGEYLVSPQPTGITKRVVPMGWN